MTNWFDNLLPTRSDGFTVQVATSERDVAAAISLVIELAKGSVLPQPASQGELDSWVREICFSKYWLVLLLISPNSEAVGIAIGQYIGYDVTLDQRILRCSQLYVRQGSRQGLSSASTLLLDALFEAAKRSPLVRELFVVTIGAPSDVSKLLSRQEFALIGTQHFKCIDTFSHPAARDTFEFSSAADLNTHDLSLMLEYGKQFYRESARAFLAIEDTEIVDRVKHELEISVPGFVKIGVHQDGEIAGIITGHVDRLPLSNLSILMNSFFYIHPKFRSTSAVRRLFSAFFRKASALKVDGVILGTSSQINSDRVGRLLEIMGYKKVGAVYSKRVPRDLLQ